MTAFYKDSLLDLWRRVARHAAPQELLDGCRPLLKACGSAVDLSLWSLDGTHRSLQLLAESPARSKPSATKWNAKDSESTVAWIHLGRAVNGPATEASTLAPGLSLPVGPLCFWAGPLREGDISLGVLLLTSGQACAELAMVGLQLAELFSVALVNQRQWRELNQLREAAEADRRKLLFRLDRQDISDSIVGAESGLRVVMERVAQVSRSDAPVLLLGETGSGKEVVARALHNLSSRQAGPFIRVNCGAIPPQLVDSQLFGHERGSFTGAHDCHKGWFERADGGTLFLDEIGELPLPAQVRLLRILQDGSFERVGGRRQLKTDLRIVAATHRDLRQMVERSEFREDLWYRIAVFPISIPPLRDRCEDIPALASHLALSAAKRLGSPSLIPSPEDIQRLLDYPWPGNVRELAAVIERAAILGNGCRLEIRQALGCDYRATQRKSNPAEPSAPIDSLDQAIATHIQTALRLTNGRIDGSQGAARLLEINPSTLRARMRKLGLSRRP